MAKRIVVADHLAQAAKRAECPADCADVPLDHRRARCSDTCSGAPRDERALAEAVRILTLEALRRTRWNLAESAALLGLPLEMLRERVRRMDLRPPAEGGPAG